MKSKLLLYLAFAVAASSCAAVIYSPEPEGGREIVTENATNLLKSYPKFLSGFRFDELKIAQPYRVYYVETKDLND